MWHVQYSLGGATPYVVPFSNAKQAYDYYHYQRKLAFWIELVNPDGEVVLSA